MMRVGLQAVYEIRFVQKRTGHLYRFEAMSQDFVNFVAANQSSDVDKLHVGHELAELQGIFQEEGFAIAVGLCQDIAHEGFIVA